MFCDLKHIELLFLFLPQFLLSSHLLRSEVIHPTFDISHPLMVTTIRSDGAYETSKQKDAGTTSWTRWINREFIPLLSKIPTQVPGPFPFPSFLFFSSFGLQAAPSTFQLSKAMRTTTLVYCFLLMELECIHPRAFVNMQRYHRLIRSYAFPKEKVKRYINRG